MRQSLDNKVGRAPTLGSTRTFAIKDKKDGKLSEDKNVLAMKNILRNMCLNKNTQSIKLNAQCKNIVYKYV